jgi:hypothetical protein
MIPTIRANIRATEPRVGVATVHELDWNAVQQADGGPPLDRPVDLVVASDVVYHRDAVAPLLNVVLAACRAGAGPHHRRNKTVVLVGVHERGHGVLTRYFRYVRPLTVTRSLAHCMVHIIYIHVYSVCVPWIERAQVAACI